MDLVTTQERDLGMVDLLQRVLGKRLGPGKQRICQLVGFFQLQAAPRDGKDPKRLKEPRWEWWREGERERSLSWVRW